MRFRTTPQDALRQTGAHEGAHEPQRPQSALGSANVTPMLERLRVSHSRFWAALIAFLLVNLLIARFFEWVVRTLELNNATRTFHREVCEVGFGPAAGNLLLNWLPHTLLVLASCWAFLRLVHLDLRAALAGGIRRSDAWIIPVGALLLTLYQLVVRHHAGTGPPPNLAALDWSSIVLIALYTLRFLPSALVEELVFRGSLFAGVEGRYGTATGFVVSVLLLGAAHLYGGRWLFVNAMILGTVFTLVYWKTRSLALTTILHLYSNVAYAYLNYRG